MGFVKIIIMEARNGYSIKDRKNQIRDKTMASRCLDRYQPDRVISL
jgi:hypothetical protein